MRHRLCLLPIFTLMITNVCSDDQSRDGSWRDAQFSKGLTNDPGWQKYHPWSTNQRKLKNDGDNDEFQERWYSGSGNKHVLHKNEHDHNHDHSHAHLHDNEHSHNHTNLHVEEHDHTHEHKHTHKHNHIHGHENNHTHSNEHEHAHKHKHENSNEYHEHKDNYAKRRNSIMNDSKLEDYFIMLKRQQQNSRPTMHFSEPSINNSGKRQRKPLANQEAPKSNIPDYQKKSVEEYIGDSGKEFEGAAEKIVEGYMGDYMDKYMNEWYIKYCEDTGKYCDQIKEYQPTSTSVEPVSEKPFKPNTKSTYGVQTPFTNAPVSFPPQSHASGYIEKDMSVTMKTPFLHEIPAPNFHSSENEKNHQSYMVKPSLENSNLGQFDMQQVHPPQTSFGKNFDNSIKLSPPVRDLGDRKPYAPKQKIPMISMNKKREEKKDYLNFFDKYLSAFKELTRPRQRRPETKLRKGRRQPPKKQRKRRLRQQIQSKKPKQTPQQTVWPDSNSFMNDFENVEELFNGNLLASDDYETYYGDDGTQRYNSGYAAIEETSLDGYVNF